MIHLGPSEDVDSSLYLAWAPVSGLIAVPLKCGEYLSGGSFRWVLLLGPTSGATPRSLAGSLPVAFSIGVVACWYRISLRLMCSPLWDCSMVPSNVSVGGFHSSVIRSSNVARRRLVLLIRGKRLWGNHFSWLTIQLCLDSLAQTVKHL
jgi:hypothetical protein